MQCYIGLNGLNFILNCLIWVKQKDLHVQQFEFDLNSNIKLKSENIISLSVITSQKLVFDLKKEAQKKPHKLCNTMHSKIFQYVKSQIKETTHWQCKE